MFGLGKKLRVWRDNQRLAHAYLLTAETRASLHDLASLAAKWLLCENPLEDAACGSCQSCLQAVSGNHPDIEWLQPEGTSLKIQQMREAMKADKRMAASGHLQIFVLEDVHKLTPEAANAILKWLEEPHPERLFLLLTTAPAALLPTLRSRLMLLRVAESNDLSSGNNQELGLFSLEDDAKAEELVALAREFGEVAYGGGATGWLIVSEKYAKWNFAPSQALAFADLVIRGLRDRAVTSDDATAAHRFAALALAAFQVRKQIQGHANVQLAWETFFINSVSLAAAF